MKGKRLFKMILDIIMLVLLVLMFKKNVISMSFHEVGGLALIGLFVIHNLVNWKWIKAVFSKLFHGGINARTSIFAIINSLLAIDFILIGVSGVLMVHGAAGSWKTVHYFCAALSIILMGIHIGLHWGLIKNVLGRHGYNKGAKAVGSAVLIAALAYGIYGTASTSFVHWLTMPFSVSAYGAGEGNQGTHEENNKSDEQNSVDGITSATQSGNSTEENGRGVGDGNHQNGDSTINAENIFSTVTSYLSIMVLFAFITVIISKLLIGKRKTIGAENPNEYIIGECIEK